MRRYSALQKAIFSVFSSAPWLAENIKTVPANFGSPSTEYIRVSPVLSGKALDNKSAAGVLMVDIFIMAAKGTVRAHEIGDLLDQHFVNKSIERPEGVLQFALSTLQPMGLDKVNPSLFRYSYSLPFNFFGVA